MTKKAASSSATTRKIRIERNYHASADEVWDLWTTSKGIESWWAPDGFKVEVRKLDLRPGGELIYAMTATGPEQVEFMKQAGMPLTTESRKTLKQVHGRRRPICPRDTSPIPQPCYLTAAS